MHKLRNLWKKLLKKFKFLKMKNNQKEYFMKNNYKIFMKIILKTLYKMVIK